MSVIERVFEEQKANPFLASMACFASVSEPLLRAIKPKTLAEIGVEGGVATDLYLDYCKDSGASYVGVDPACSSAAIEKVRASGHTFIELPSLEALPKLPKCDVYILDGDHNYYTVYHELKQIECLASPNEAFPICFLHDVLWPWARRDFYYCREEIPEAFRQPATTHRMGIRPENAGVLAKGGWHVLPGVHFAETEGGARNGVRTAAEDFIRESPRKLKLTVVPAIFGLGLLYEPERLTPEAAEAMRKLENGLEYLGPLLALMERQRVETFIDILTYRRLQKAWRMIRAGEFKDVITRARSYLLPRKK